MKIIENNCVDCQLPCIHCGLSHQEVVKCDVEHCDNYARYQVTGMFSGDYCDDCFEELLKDVFNELTIKEQINILSDYISVNKL